MKRPKPFTAKERREFRIAILASTVGLWILIVAPNGRGDRPMLFYKPEVALWVGVSMLLASQLFVVLFLRRRGSKV